ECKELKLPVVAHEQPIYDFLQTVSDISPEFSNVWTVNLQTKEVDGEPLPDLYRIVELFRNHQRLSNVPKGRAFKAHSPLRSKDSRLITRTTTKSKRSLCLCGAEQRFKECLYLIESIRPKDWPAIQKQIDGKPKI